MVEANTRDDRNARRNDARGIPPPSQTHFEVELMAKDMSLVRELAEANGVPLEAGALAEKTFTELRDAGDGSRDFSILLARRAEQAGASLGPVD